MRFVVLALALLALTGSQAWASVPPAPHVPEPASLALLAIGLGGVAAARFGYRRRK